MQSSPLLQVKVWGEWACFTRPEMKAERVSYPMITPSAARGVLEAIFWKPEFDWRVREIWVLNPIRYFSILRNEINTKQSHRSAFKWVSDGGGYFADEDRAQRHTLALRDVAYIIRADIELRPHADADVAKYRDQFRRRVQRGQCMHRPYLGCREFGADFAEPDGSESPVEVTEDLGRMLGELRYEAGGRVSPIFFEAKLEKGILRVPQSIYEEVTVR
ncbi:MAG: type I-C CRISPR-associated protein Cas5c [Armatimonadota bacterium]|nr:type I-C CRISPR-associated protein Cas5c [Armatimonadota bacterium]